MLTLLSDLQSEAPIVGDTLCAGISKHRERESEQSLGAAVGLVNWANFYYLFIHYCWACFEVGLRFLSCRPGQD
jgi:hypothetical protein